MQERINSSLHRVRTKSRIIPEIEAEIENLLKNKNVTELDELQVQVQKKLSGNEPVDVEYWENLLKSIVVWKSKAKLREIHQELLRKRLDKLRKRQREVANRAQQEMEQTIKKSQNTKETSAEELYDPSMSPDLRPTIERKDRELLAIDAEEENKNLVFYFYLT